VSTIDLLNWTVHQYWIQVVKIRGKITVILRGIEFDVQELSNKPVLIMQAYKLKYQNSMHAQNISPHALTVSPEMYLSEINVQPKPLRIDEQC
jgi:hypothetical protein